MSKYTTEVRYLCEVAAGLTESAGYDDVADIIEDAIPVIFDFDFPIWDESYRNVLCTKILKHYYTREIGFETAGLWKLKLDTKLNEIMPYYNSRYLTVAAEYNPLNDTDYIVTHNAQEAGNDSRDNSVSEVSNRTSSGSAVSEDSGTDSTSKIGSVNEFGSTDVTDQNVEKFSDTPQGALTGVLNGTYLTNATVNDGTRNQEDEKTTVHNVTDTTTHGKKNEQSNSEVDIGNSNRTGSESGAFSTTKEYIEHIVGKVNNRSYASVITEWRDAIINIDMEVINELKDLFMLIW